MRPLEELATGGIRRSRPTPGDMMGSQGQLGDSFVCVRVQVHMSVRVSVHEAAGDKKMQGLVAG